VSHEELYADDEVEEATDGKKAAKAGKKGGTKRGKKG